MTNKKSSRSRHIGVLQVANIWSKRPRKAYREIENKVLKEKG